MDATGEEDFDPFEGSLGVDATGGGEGLERRDLLLPEEEAGAGTDVTTAFPALEDEAAGSVLHEPGEETR